MLYHLSIRNWFQRGSLVTLTLILSIWVTGCSQPSPTPAEAVSSPTMRPPPAPTATAATQLSPIATPVPTPTTQTSPLPTPTQPGVTDDLAFDGDSAYNFVLEQCARGPRPTGS